MASIEKISYKITDEDFFRLAEKVEKEQGIDFTQYKDGCAKRRVWVRLRATRSRTIEDYLSLLDKDKEEYLRLIDAFTINVSSFFRNPEMFKFLKKWIIPDLIKYRWEKGGKLKFLSAGCATGEEPYSLAILLNEHFPRATKKLGLRIYAIDLDANAIQYARAGEYEPNRLSCLDDELKEKYFEPCADKKFRLKEELKQLVKFSTDNLICPKLKFSDLDLILCRNVLIYFTRALQNKILRRLSEMLRLEGVLVLGHTDVFWEQEKAGFYAENVRERVYRKLRENGNITRRT